MTTIRAVDSREKCHWLNAWQRFKRSKGMQLNGILECNVLVEKRATYPGTPPTDVSSSTAFHTSPNAPCPIFLVMVRQARFTSRGTRTPSFVISPFSFSRSSSPKKSNARIESLACFGAIYGGSGQIEWSRHREACYWSHAGWLQTPAGVRCYHEGAATFSKTAYKYLTF
jgi:hypothetical protein